MFMDCFISACVRFVFFSRPVPTAPPQDVRGRARDSTSIELTWKPPPMAQQNGRIIEYKVFYVDANILRGRLEASVVARQETSCLLVGLRKWTPYKIWVTASTRVGDGPVSDTILVHTEEDGMSAGEILSFLRSSSLAFDLFFSNNWAIGCR